jgi:PAS domain-containing protein
VFTHFQFRISILEHGGFWQGQHLFWVWRRPVNQMWPLWEGNNRLMSLAFLDTALTPRFFESENFQNLSKDLKASLETFVNLKGVQDIEEVLYEVRQQCVPEKVSPCVWVKPDLSEEEIDVLRNYLEQNNAVKQAVVEDTFCDTLRKVRRVWMRNQQLKTPEVARLCCYQKNKIRLHWLYRGISDEVFSLMERDSLRGPENCHCFHTMLGLKELKAGGDLSVVTPILEKHIRLLCAAPQRLVPKSVSRLVPYMLQGIIDTYVPERAWQQIEAARANERKQKAQPVKKDALVDSIPRTLGEHYICLVEDATLPTFLSSAQAALNKLFQASNAGASTSSTANTRVDTRTRIIFCDPPYGVLTGWKNKHDEVWTVEQYEQFARNCTTLVGSEGVVWLKIADHQEEPFKAAFKKQVGWGNCSPANNWLWLMDANTDAGVFCARSKNTNMSPVRCSCKILGFFGPRAKIDFYLGLKQKHASGNVYCNPIRGANYFKYLLEGEDGQEEEITYREQMPEAVVAEFLCMYVFPSLCPWS